MIDSSVLNILPERIYLRLFDNKRRKLFLKKELLKLKHSLTEVQIDNVSRLTFNYSCRNLTQLIKEAAMASVKDLTNVQVKNMTAKNLRPVHFKDFENAMRLVPPTVNKESMQRYFEWNEEFGDHSASLSSNSDNDEENVEMYSFNNQSVRDDSLMRNFK